MRKRLILAAMAAVIAFASCQHEPVVQTGQFVKPVGGENSESPVFTASIAGSTKTTVNVTDGKLAWELDDEITVTDASHVSAVYVIESIDEVTGKATFVIKQGESPLGEGPYTAVYGSEPSITQTYSETAGKLYMTGEETSANELTFSVGCGLLRLNLTQVGVDISKIVVTGTPAAGEQTTFTLTCPQSVNISSARDFCIALPEGAYTKIVMYDSDGSTCTKTVKSTPLAIAVNHIKPVTFTSLNFEYKPLAYYLYNTVEEGAVQW